jgi:predicted nucleic acid-binding protein
MEYLVDSNVFLEGLLEQEKVEQVIKFFQTMELSQLGITDFSLHSIGAILLGLNKRELFVDFLKDMVGKGMNVLSLNLEGLEELCKIAQKFNLDFDDAYQYTVAKKYNLQIISFDKDFDRTKRRRKEPSEVL